MIRSLVAATWASTLVHAGDDTLTLLERSIKSLARGPGGSAMPEVELPAGTIEYEDTGGDRPAVALLHGLIMDGSLWRHVVQDLRADYRCVVPTLPLGGHRMPMRPDADLSMRGI